VKVKFLFEAGLPFVALTVFFADAVAITQNFSSYFKKVYLIKIQKIPLLCVGIFTQVTASVRFKWIGGTF
jgi:hypothetical protein